MTSLPSLAGATLALAYFRTPPDYFWRWAEAGEIVEWLNGRTIGYREELQAVLDALAPTGLPPLGSVLLLLAACADSWADSDALGTLHGLLRNTPTETGDAPSLRPSDPAAHLQDALNLLDCVAELPRELRTGPAKLHLFRTLGAAMPAAVTADNAPGVLHEWVSGRLDVLRAVERSLSAYWKLNEDLEPLRQLSYRFRSSRGLAALLRTGQEAPPEPLPEPPVPEPEPAEGDLLDQLSQDARTYGLAQLTRRLTAALRIPLHTHAASELPLGGVADISNRGSFDRLLLSELAQDDLMLLARLAGNEAMYLRREAPPTPDVRPQVVLLDTTLRLWGVPRVFGLAAALAWLRQARQPRLAAPTAAYALGGQQATDLDLDTFDGVLQALERLDVAPHAGPALTEFVAGPAAAGADCLLVTAAELLTQPAFAAALAEARAGLRYLLTVDRGGELQLYDYQRGQRQLLSTTRYDLDALLFAPMPARPKKPGQPAAPRPKPGPLTDVPAFLQQEPAPLYWPATGLRPSRQTTFYHDQFGALGVTRAQRVLYLPSANHAAHEVLPFIEAGSYHFGFDGENTVFVLVSAYQRLVFYAFTCTDAPTSETTRIDLSRELGQTSYLQEVSYLAGCFYLRLNHPDHEPVIVFDCRRREVVVRHQGPLPKGEEYKSKNNRHRRQINSGYTVLQRVERLSISRRGLLLVDGHEFELGKDYSWTPEQLRLRRLTDSPNPQPVRAVLEGVETLPDNPKVYFRRFRWPDGSTTVADSRGLLHLRSANARLPEITLLMVIGQQPSAAWAADGVVSGATYFTGTHEANTLLDVNSFYQHYVQLFIDQVMIK